jgi:hypothetical protein
MRLIGKERAETFDLLLRTLGNTEISKDDRSTYLRNADFELQLDSETYGYCLDIIYPETPPANELVESSGYGTLIASAVVGYVGAKVVDYLRGRD